MTKFGQKIQELRIECGKTLGDVAEKIGCKVSYLSDVEHGRKKPLGPEQLRQFANYLGADIKLLQSMAANERNTIEISVSQNRKLNDVAFALARSADSGEFDELKLEMQKLLKDL